MPSVARVAALVICGLVAGVATTGCGSSSGRATGFCATIHQESPAFNSLDAEHQTAALAAFDRFAAHAPEAVAGDLRTVSGFHRILSSNPKQIVKQPSLLTNYLESIKRVDVYLHDTCGVRIPPLGKLF